MLIWFPYPKNKMHSFSMMTLDTIWLQIFQCWCFTTEAQKIRISPNSSRVAPILKQREKFLPLFFGGNNLCLIPAPPPISSVPTNPPASHLSSQSVHVCLLPLILYLHALWPPSPTGFKVTKTTLPLRTLNWETNRAVTTQQWTIRHPGI